MNRTALITGTTSGIGAAFCDLLTKEKYNLILVSRDANALSKQAEFLRTETAVHIFCYNLSDAKVLKKIFEHVTAARLSVDILINNAGFNEAGYIIDTNLAKELEMVQVHINHHADRYAVGTNRDEGAQTSGRLSYKIGLRWKHTTTHGRRSRRWFPKLKTVY